MASIGRALRIGRGVQVEVSATFEGAHRGDGVGTRLGSRPRTVKKRPHATDMDGQGLARIGKLCDCA